MTAALTDRGVRRMVLLADAEGRRISFDVVMRDDGLYMKGTDDRTYRGPLTWDRVYGMCCVADHARRQARRKK